MTDFVMTLPDGYTQINKIDEGGQADVLLCEGLIRI